MTVQAPPIWWNKDQCILSFQYKMSMKFLFTKLSNICVNRPLPHRGDGFTLQLLGTISGRRLALICLQQVWIYGDNFVCLCKMCRISRKQAGIFPLRGAVPVRDCSIWVRVQTALIGISRALTLSYSCVRCGHWGKLGYQYLGPLYAIFATVNLQLFQNKASK